MTDERSREMLAAEVRRLQGQVDVLGEAIKDTCWKAARYGETEDGDIAAYILPKGTVHRLIGAAQSCGINAAFRSDDSPGNSAIRP